MLAAFLFFAPEARKRMWIWLVVALTSSLGLLLAETRGVWIATAAGGLYLLWVWRRWLVMLLPIVVVAGGFFFPYLCPPDFLFLPPPPQKGFERFAPFT